MLVYWKVY
jgi:hypothetical protein